jgi:aspartokinase
MIKITDIIESTITQSRELSFGFSQGLFNLSQLARFLKPIVVAKAKKDISEKALLMALSRMQRKKTSIKIKEGDPFFVEHVSLNTGLSIVTFLKNSTNHAAVVHLYKKVQKSGGYMTISEGMSEITVIVEQGYIDDVYELFPDKPLIEKKGAISLGIRFHKRYLQVPGYLYKVLQALTLQGINIWELSSTATEVSVYLDARDTHLALDTILGSFRQRKRTAADS